MPTGRRVGLIILLAGSLVTAMSSTQKTMVAQGSPHYTTNTPYHSTISTLWPLLEEDLVIIMGCMPTLPAVSIDFSGLSNLTSQVSSLL